MLRSIGYSSHARHVSIWFGFSCVVRSIELITTLFENITTLAQLHQFTRAERPTEDRPHNQKKRCIIRCLVFSPVFSHQCVAQCTLHEFAFSRSRCVGCSSETLTHCVHIPQALSLDQENVTLCFTETKDKKKKEKNKEKKRKTRSFKNIWKLKQIFTKLYSENFTTKSPNLSNLMTTDDKLT